MRVGSAVRSCAVSLVSTIGALSLAGTPSLAQVGTVRAEQKISDTEGGFEGDLDPGDQFGVSVAALGDLDGDGITDLAVGAWGDGDGGAGQGAVWILFMNTDGTVASLQKISETAGGFGGDLDPSDLFGAAVAALGDLNGDGTVDLAVGAWGDSDNGNTQGAVWILFLNPDGTVASEQKINETLGGFGGDLDPGDGLGVSMSALGDIDGDGRPELAVGARWDDDGGTDQGAVWILSLDADGTVASERKISAITGGFGGNLDDEDRFGSSLAALGDLDGDGVVDLAVGADGDDDGGSSQGAVWILFLNTDGTVRSQQKISENHGGFGGHLDVADFFGVSVAAVGSLDGGLTRGLAVGAYADDDGGDFQGAVWLLFLKPDGTVSREQKISGTAGGFTGDLDTGDGFGGSVAGLGDLDGDGAEDVAVGAQFDDDGDVNQGAVWVLSLRDKHTARPFAGPLGSATMTTPFQADPGSDVPVPARAASIGGGSGQLRSRNGSGKNESCLASSAAPRAGEEWQVDVDLTSHPAARGTLVWASERRLPGLASLHGELLVDAFAGAGLFRSFVPSSGAIDVHRFAVPLALAGRSFSLQAFVFDARGGSLTNALDVVVAGSLDREHCR